MTGFQFQNIFDIFAINQIQFRQGVTKPCGLSWLTNGALEYEPKCVGGGGVAGSQPISTAVHRSPNKTLEI
jgi:hypothetical protein